jgi:hypothetical protein
MGTLAKLARGVQPKRSREGRQSDVLSVDSSLQPEVFSILCDSVGR